jgi:predicted DNA-binding transcriptional regulator AlpA
MTSEQHEVSLLTEREVARRLAVSTGLLRKWRRLGDGPEFLRLGRAVRYNEYNLRRWIEQLRRA